MAVMAAIMANQDYNSDSNDNGSTGNLATSMLGIGAWLGADWARGRTRRITGDLGARLGLSPRTGPTIPGIKVGKKHWMHPTYTGKLKGWGEFQKEVELKSAGLGAKDAKKAYKSSSTRLFGAARTEALLTAGLRVANVAMLAPMLYGMTYHGFKGIQRLGFELERPGFGWGRTSLSAMASTDRQRSIQALHNSEFNGRSSMGQEAFLYHQ